ncbi:hypothetical protein PMAYCL1PPCAC_11365, partial [Pristionchus mayeri]
ITSCVMHRFILFLLCFLSFRTAAQMLQPRVHLPLQDSLSSGQTEKVFCGEHRCAKSDCVVRFNDSHAYLKCIQ